MKFSIKDFFSKCDQIRRNLRIWSHLLKNFIFCAVNASVRLTYRYIEILRHENITWLEIPKNKLPINFYYVSFFLSRFDYR